VRPNASGSATGTVQAPLVALSTPQASFPRIGGVAQSPAYGFQLLPAGVGSFGVSFNVGLFAELVCNENIGSGATIAGCTGSTVQTSAAMTLQFGVAQVAVSLPANTANGDVLLSDLKSATPSITTTLQIRFATAEITDITSANCPDLSNIYLPNNGAVSIEGGTFVSSAPAVSTVTQAPLHELIVVARLGSAASVASNFTSVNDVVGRIPWGRRGMVTGFKNTTLSQDHPYEMRFLIRDAAGFVSPFNGACSTLNCCISGVRTADVETFLESSRCFIASAVFEGENSKPVLWLRSFRNRVLLRFEVGRKFARFYYRYSPEASRWLKANPFFRFTARILLVPFVGGAWFFSLWDGVDQASAQSTSYIDRLKRTMPKDITGPEDYENYTERVIKKDLKDSPPPSGSYTERLKRTDPKANDKAEKGSYTERLRQSVEPSDLKSVIQSVYEGKSELKEKKIGKVKQAAGVRVGASIDHSISIPSKGSSATLQSIYGNRYYPDVQFFYDYYFLQNPIFGNLGIGASAGLVYLSRRASFQVPLVNPVTNQPFSSVTDIRLRFYVVPVSAHFTYRFQLMKYVVPFVYGGPAAVFYQERRTDSQDTKKGYSLGSMWGGGAAFQLNWLFPKTTWELYSSTGVHELFLTIDYRKTQTPKQPVEFNMAGLTAGLTYAF
jgi:hypothetical protein